jgi:hypothetical protein
MSQFSNRVTDADVAPVLDERAQMDHITTAGVEYIKIDMKALTTRGGTKPTEKEKLQWLLEIEEKLASKAIFADIRLSQPVMTDNNPNYKRGSFRPWPHVLVPVNGPGGQQAAAKATNEHIEALLENQAQLTKMMAVLMADKLSANPEAAELLKQLNTPKSTTTTTVENETPTSGSEDAFDETEFTS